MRMFRPRIHLSTALLVMILAALLLAMNLRPNVFRAQNVEERAYRFCVKPVT